MSSEGLSETIPSTRQVRCIELGLAPCGHLPAGALTGAGKAAGISRTLRAIRPRIALAACYASCPVPPVPGIFKLLSPYSRLIGSRLAFCLYIISAIFSIGERESIEGEPFMALSQSFVDGRIGVSGSCRGRNYAVKA